MPSQQVKPPINYNPDPPIDPTEHCQKSRKVPSVWHSPSQEVRRFPKGVEKSYAVIQLAVPGRTRFETGIGVSQTGNRRRKSIRVRGRTGTRKTGPTEWRLYPARPGHSSRCHYYYYYDCYYRRVSFFIFFFRQAFYLVEHARTTSPVRAARATGLHGMHMYASFSTTRCPEEAANLNARDVRAVFCHFPPASTRAASFGPFSSNVNCAVPGTQLPSGSFKQLFVFRTRAATRFGDLDETLLI